MRFTFPTVLLLLAIPSVRTASATERVDFQTQIKPIFAKRCISCHGPEKQESNLRLDQRASMRRGGDYGVPTIVPGKLSESFLLAVVKGTEPDLQMPPEGNPLAPEQIELLTKWIVQGANWPGQMSAKFDSKPDHWSFRPMVRPPIPRVDGSGSNPIDAFILRKLKANQLDLQSPADRRTLLRRVSIDLTGLPPTVEELNAFLDDKDVDDDAYARVVSRLLASPHYGERWAQHWLDVIRWGETVGFETNAERPNAWHYRDWVIQAFNDDKPYDRFIFEQIAGDSVKADAALGFLVSGPANLPGQVGRDEAAMRQARQDELDEVVKTVSQSLFGLTIGCARCHNHKFDPITQRDYYAMQAMFGGLNYGFRRLRGEQNDKWTAMVPAARQKVQQLKAELEKLRVELELRPALTNTQSEQFEPVEAKAVRMRIDATHDNGPASLWEFEIWATNPHVPPSNVALASAGGKPSASSFALANQSRHFDNLVDGSTDRRQAFGWVAAKKGPAWIQIDLPEAIVVDRITWHYGYSTPVSYQIDVLPVSSTEWITVAHTDNRIPRLDDSRVPEDVKLDGVSNKNTTRVMTLIANIRKAQANLSRLTSGPQAYAASFNAQPEPTWLLLRGDAMRRAGRVEPSIPAILQHAGSTEPVTEVERRIALANHLIGSEHPLTARVMVNRIWQHHFGIGLVETPSDFGKMGAKPSHPELLDWLATTFIENGWSLKQLHELIVTSHTYRQTSRPNSQALAMDSDCRLLWRYPPRRMDAEAIRDSILFVSGKLNTKMGGRGFDFFSQRGGLSDYMAKGMFDEEGWRRMVYAHKIRMQAVDIFGNFDCPDAGQMQPLRTQSTTPLQSLGLLNSPFTNRQAMFFAQRVLTKHQNDANASIDHCFLLALSRKPSDLERKYLVQLAEEHGLQQVCRVLFNSSEFLFLQ